MAAVERCTHPCLQSPSTEGQLEVSPRSPPAPGAQGSASIHTAPSLCQAWNLALSGGMGLSQTKTSRGAAREGGTSHVCFSSWHCLAGQGAQSSVDKGSILGSEFQIPGVGVQGKLPVPSRWMVPATGSPLLAK